ncbi:MAG TPA: hypothetical protein VJ743_20050, partial [Albitalea sp.]|nr:hypothetical protein [Albitalea sp.]
MDFAEFFTDHARGVAPLARRRGLLFLFDYRGPFVDVDADEDAMRAALERLSNAALDLLDDGFIFLSAQADWSDAGLADLAISIAGTGQRAGDQRLGEAIERLRLTERPREVDNPEGTRVAAGICPLTGSTVSFAANRSDGILLAFDMTAPASLLDAEPAPNAEGARAWLISETAGICQSLVRRLQRLGWATSTFASPQQALQQLSQMKPGMARPSLVVGVDSPQLTAESLQPLRDALAPCT